MAGDPRFLKVLDEVRAVHERKAADYGSDQDPYANIRASAEFGIEPWVGAIVRSNDKTHRIKQFVKKGRLENESVRDSISDNIVYYIIALILYDEMVEKKAQAHDATRVEPKDIKDYH